MVEMAPQGSCQQQAQSSLSPKQEEENKPAEEPEKPTQQINTFTGGEAKPNVTFSQDTTMASEETKDPNQGQQNE